MDFTSRMTALLGQFRRERNGAEADALRLVGNSYGLNYGVNLPVVRALARAQTPDHAFARFLWQQQVRELRLAALYVAQPACLTVAELPFWEQGIVNSEVAGEMAFALLCRVDVFAEVFERWVVSDNPLLVYAALMAAPRAEQLPAAWIAPALTAVVRDWGDAPAARLVAEGAVALLVALGAQNATNRQAVLAAAGSLVEATPAAEYLREELAWRLTE